MKRPATILLFFVLSVAVWAQTPEMLKSNPRLAYGGDYPYPQNPVSLTKSPSGYEPFYISHYARHGSRYYWSEDLYKDLDTLLTLAHARHLLTAEGEAFHNRYMAAKEELLTGATELTDLGWQQHQYIARTMYQNFPKVFKKGGNVLAISSLSGRCVMSMSAFCQELVQCNPLIEIREQSSRFSLDGVVPTDGRNPVKHQYPKNVKPRFEKQHDIIQQMRGTGPTLREKILQRVFTCTDSLPGDAQRIAGNLLSLYTSLPSIAHEGMMGCIVSDEELAEEWEASNLWTYAWVFGPQYEMLPILQDILDKASAVIEGKSDRIADLRFGHDTCIGPLTVLMGINGADLDPEDPREVKNCYQSWETCKACNIQLVFYRHKRHPENILVKCLLNGSEASLPIATDISPYYHWTDFRDHYLSLFK